MDITAYRRIYFALCKRLGIDEETRHEFNRAQVGKCSTGEFVLEDWRVVTAELQRRAGQAVEPGRPRVRSRAGGEPGSMITAAQYECIVRLAGEIRWTVGPEAFVRSRLLAPTRKAVWNGRWESLWRSEACNVITVMRRMKEKAQDGTATTES
jgi:hypothetical protein